MRMLVDGLMIVAGVASCIALAGWSYDAAEDILAPMDTKGMDALISEAASQDVLCTWKKESGKAWTVQACSLK